jgi:hypothetical protein
VAKAKGGRAKGAEEADGRKGKEEANEGKKKE